MNININKLSFHCSGKYVKKENAIIKKINRENIKLSRNMTKYIIPNKKGDISKVAIYNNRHNNNDYYYNNHNPYNKNFKKSNFIMDLITAIIESLAD